MGKKYTLKTFTKKANSVHSNKFKYLSFEGVNKPVKIECPIHGIYYQLGNSHLKGFGCAKCTGNNKSTTEEFIKKAVNVHGDRYDYSSVKYINAKTPVEIICKKHGTFQQTPDKHINAKHDCPKCSHGGIKLTHDEFETMAREVHGNKYQYLTEYVNSDTPMDMFCEIHGAFKQTPHNHIHDSNGCPKCARGIIAQNVFIDKIVSIHGDVFNFPEEYNGINTKINFECKKHGLFLQTPRGILGGVGCPQCKLEKDFENFIKLGNEIHGNKFDYSLITEYKNTTDKLPIKCPHHDVFHQSAKDHVNNKNGCPLCKESRSEKEIRIFLEINKIIYLPQHKFDGCRTSKINNNSRLAFDFYLPDYNMCIEYNGEQHYTFNKFFHKTQEDFEHRKILDQIKIDYCKNNNISLLIIRYDEEIIPILNENFINNVQHQSQ